MIVLGPLGGTGGDSGGVIDHLVKIEQALEAGVVVSTVPVAPGGDLLNVVKGDTYTAATGRALKWTKPDGGWPDLTNAASIKLSIYSRQDGSLLLETAGQAPDDAAVQVELSAEQTASLPSPPARAGRAVARFTLKATMNDATVVTLARGLVLIWL